MSESRPTDPRQRALAIDALRGWALIGIAIVNVPWIGFYESLPTLVFDDATRAALPLADLASALFVEGLCEGRFYPIFSMLFGLGTGLLLERGLATYARRIAALFVFGALHATFGWYGDVLLNYAAAGMVLASFARLGPRPLFALAGIFFVITQLASLRFDTWFGPTAAEDLAEHIEYADSQLRVYRDGTFASISQHRFEEMLSYFHADWNISYRLNVLTMATLGLAIERTGVLGRLDALRPRIGLFAIALVVLGVALSALLVLAPQLYIVAGDVLAAGYAMSFVWLALGRSAPLWATPFASVGRMALSCYLGQTLCFTLFFYGYGLGMYGELGPAQGLALSVGVYAMEALVATLWLRWFEYGPVELVWRTLTYLRVPRMLRGR